MRVRNLWWAGPGRKSIRGASKAMGETRRVCLLVPMLVFLFSAPVLAQGDGGSTPEKGAPTLKQASIRVTPGQDGVEVVERITLSNVQGLEEVEHVFTRLGDAEAEDLSVTAGGRELAVDRERGDLIDRIVVSPPRGASGDFSYEVSYRYPESADSARVPLVVPTVPPSGDANSVTLELAVPEGRYLLESFPVIDSGNTGVVRTSMIGFPNYSSFELGSSPIGIFTRSNVYTALAIALILVCVGGLLLYDRRSGARPRTREVADV